MNRDEKASELRRIATRRDVFWCFGISIVISVLSVGIGIIRTQQLSDQRVSDNTAQLARETDQLRYSLAASNFSSCTRGNVKDARLVAYVSSAVDRATAAAKATIASPLTTPEQKATAVRNLATAAYQSEQLKKALKPENCGTVPRAP